MNPMHYDMNLLTPPYLSDSTHMLGWLCIQTLDGVLHRVKETAGRCPGVRPPDSGFESWFWLSLLSFVLHLFCLWFNSPVWHIRMRGTSVQEENIMVCGDIMTDSKHSLEDQIQSQALFLTLAPARRPRRRRTRSVHLVDLTTYVTPVILVVWPVWPPTSYKLQNHVHQLYR